MSSSLNSGSSLVLGKCTGVVSSAGNLAPQSSNLWWQSYQVRLPHGYFDFPYVTRQTLTGPLVRDDLLVQRHGLLQPAPALADLGYGERWAYSHSACLHSFQNKYENTRLAGSCSTPVTLLWDPWPLQGAARLQPRPACDRHWFNDAWVCPQKAKWDVSRLW